MRGVRLTLFLILVFILGFRHDVDIGGRIINGEVVLLNHESPAEALRRFRTQKRLTKFVNLFLGVLSWWDDSEKQKVCVIILTVVNCVYQRSVTYRGFENEYSKKAVRVP